MKKKNGPRLIAWEIVLLISSVFVFRGLWTLLDKLPWKDNPWTLAFSLVAGSALSGFAYWQLKRDSDE